MSNPLPHRASTRDDTAVHSVPPQVGSIAAGTARVLVEPDGGFFRSHGTQLVARGYEIVPITPGTKRPASKGWVGNDYNHESSRKWRGHGVGVKTGRPNAEGHAVMAVDIDVLDPAVASKLVIWCRDNIGDAPSRVGQAPKVLLAYRTGRPFRKKPSRTFRSQDGKVHAVEVLGTGQQFLAYAIHPGTGQPYSWHGAELVDTPIDALPEITEQQAFDLINYFESLGPRDWEPVTHERAARAGEQHETSKTPLAPLWKLRLAVEVIPVEPGDTYDSWIKVGMALCHATEGGAEGLALWHEWSSMGAKYDPHALDTRWEGFARLPGERHLSAATLFRMADEADLCWRDRAREQEVVEREQTVQRFVEKMTADENGRADAAAEQLAEWEQSGDLTPLKTVCIADLAGKPIPERKWIVAGLIPDRTVSDMAGDGGVGKSQLALQLGVAVATGGMWLGNETISSGSPVLYVSAEDELHEIQRRTGAIAGSEGMSLANLGNLHIVDLTTGSDTELVVPDPQNRQSVKPTPLLAQLEALIAVRRPKLVILDTRADMFGGNEIDRVQVRSFIRRLRELCLSYDMAILLLSHPSRKGMETGDGQSGSTGWSNSVRSRLYLQRHGDDPDLRVLSSEKANYGPKAAEITLRWRDDVFVVEGAVGGVPPDRAEQDRRVEARVLELLREFAAQGRHVNPSSGANYAPKKFAAADGLYSKGQYQAAIERLFHAGKLAVVTADRARKLVEVEAAAGAKLRELAEREGGPHAEN